MKVFPWILICFFIFISCHSNKTDLPIGKKVAIDNTFINNTEKIVYQSPELIIEQVSTGVYRHISFLNSETYGRVPCNGMVVTGNGEAVIFDTPSDDQSSQELISWLQDTLNYKINAVVPTHFHKDCLGGVSAFDQAHIPSFANLKTIRLAKARGFHIPGNTFKDSMIFHCGTKSIITKFFGEGHTEDNIVAYVPDEKILFGGCLIKELDASKGNLEDANVEEWPKTVDKVTAAFPDVEIVIPGHGKPGDRSLLNYTRNLFND